jgi:hypothetical protein
LLGVFAPRNGSRLSLAATAAALKSVDSFEKVSALLRQSNRFSGRVKKKTSAIEQEILSRSLARVCDPTRTAEDLCATSPKSSVPHTQHGS